ncbi:MAG: F0F1 ATP synthase subunit delta [Alphaproteobacteria bacterium]|nr:F0F1 ATP synthase subunit delta [Alphaproteobacteria bacterium]
MAAETTGMAGLAERYAAALYELADEGKLLDRVADDLRRLSRMLDESADLARLIRSPVLSRQEQGRAMKAVLEKAGVDALTAKFVGLVAQNRRLFALPATIKAFLTTLARRRGEIAAEVTSAQAMSPAQADAVTAALRQAMGGKVSVETRVDPSLLGGMVVRVGSRMVDSSLKTKLQKLELAMKGLG